MSMSLSVLKRFPSPTRDRNGKVVRGADLKSHAPWTLSAGNSRSAHSTFSSTSTTSRKPELTFTGRNNIYEMTREQAENTGLVFRNVRHKGPKEARIKRTELMGEHTKKPLHFIKVTQNLAKYPQMANIDVLKNFLEERIGDIGDAYRPVDEQTKEPHEFFFIGFYKKLNAEETARNMPTFNCDGVELNIIEAKSWFIELYPKPVMFECALSEERDMFLEEIEAIF